MRGSRAYAGIKRSSILTNLAMSSVNASPSNVGSAMRAAERFSRRMFLSGLKRRSSPLGFLYAFMPSKASKA